MTSPWPLLYNYFRVWDLPLCKSKKALNTYEDIIVQVVHGCFQTLKQILINWKFSRLRFIIFFFEEILSAQSSY
jgi:hypothetical protein